MENIQKEWNLYTKKILLNELYNLSLNEKVIDFLKNYELLEIKMLRKQSELKMEVIFGQKNDTVKMIMQKVNIMSQFAPTYTCFFWTIPEEFDISQLEDILDGFEFQNFVRGKN